LNSIVFSYSTYLDTSVVDVVVDVVLVLAVGVFLCCCCWEYMSKKDHQIVVVKNW